MTKFSCCDHCENSKHDQRRCVKCGTVLCEFCWIETFESDDEVDNDLGYCGSCLHDYYEWLRHDGPKMDAGDAEYHRLAEEPGGLDRLKERRGGGF